MATGMRVALADGKELVLAQGDITREQTDAIVNAANSSLMGGGGVDGAIHRAGGPAILEECRKIVAERGPLPPGQAVATSGGNLAARYVIHTVGPIWAGGKQGEAETLASCYRESLRVADKLGLKSIAFPAISTGAFGYPLRDAAEVAVSAVAEALKGGRTVQSVRFVVFDSKSYEVYGKFSASWVW